MPWSRKSLKHMTKQQLNKIRFIAISVLVFFIACILRIDLVIPLLLITLSIYLVFSQKHEFFRQNNFLQLALLFCLLFSIGFSVTRQGVSLFYVPFCVIPMLAVLLFNELRVTLLLTMASFIALTSFNPASFYFTRLFLISGVLSMILVYGARKRSVIIRAGFIVGLVQAFILLVAQHFRLAFFDNYLLLVLNGIACGIIVIGILPVFEYLFSTVTNISLLELADFNHPLLRRLTLEAPGTYHHSLVVGNLCDAACEAVGANALLARIGAYYHDIGKLSKPEYFSENQGPGLNVSKHEALAPSMSKLVIMNHVKEGVELAKKYRLNQKIIEFIEEHHGSSLVYYFYRRALESSEEDQEITEEGFRYPGPKPKTKELAICLLADSVEAATRALKAPVLASIEEVVHKVINNKFIDGQLDECDLSLKDLEKISSVFIRILSGIYHSRVTYP